MKEETRIAIQNDKYLASLLNLGFNAIIKKTTWFRSIKEDYLNHYAEIQNEVMKTLDKKDDIN
jgi:hypothetical protein